MCSFTYHEVAVNDKRELLYTFIHKVCNYDVVESTSKNTYIHCSDSLMARTNAKTHIRGEENERCDTKKAALCTLGQWIFDSREAGSTPPVMGMVERCATVTANPMAKGPRAEIWMFDPAR